MKGQIEHPDITQANKTGYPNMVAQLEHVGIDYCGDEILMGDSIVVDPSTGETILTKNIEQYLSKVYGFQFLIT